MERREAVINALAGLGSNAIGQTKEFQNQMKSFSSFKSRNIGIQLFTIPRMVDNDFKGTLQLLSKIGYKEIEFFGPYPFSAESTKQHWETMKPMLGMKNNAFYGYTVKETAKLLQDNSLTAPSIHADMASMRENMSLLLDNLAGLNAKYVVLPALFEGRDSLDQYRKLTDEFNYFGEQMSRYGMTFMYHNHGYEHIEMDGEIPMHFMINNTNPDFVSFELDIFWMAAAGADPIEFLDSYPGRYKALHLKDASESFRFSGDGGTPDQWMAVFPKMCDPGNGVFDIPAILSHAEKSGVEHFFLERDLTPEPILTLNNSFSYLSQL